MEKRKTTRAIGLVGEIIRANHLDLLLYSIIANLHRIESIRMSHGRLLLSLKSKSNHPENQCVVLNTGQIFNSLQKHFITQTLF